MIMNEVLKSSNLRAHVPKEIHSILKKSLQFYIHYKNNVFEKYYNLNTLILQ
jgi:hypothetical protein